MADIGQEGGLNYAYRMLQQYNHPKVILRLPGRNLAVHQFILQRHSYFKTCLEIASLVRKTLFGSQHGI